MDMQLESVPTDFPRGLSVVEKACGEESLRVFQWRRTVLSQGGVCLRAGSAGEGPRMLDARDALLAIANVSASVAPIMWDERRAFDTASCYTPIRDESGMVIARSVDETKLADPFPADSLRSGRVAEGGRAHRELVLQASRALSEVGIPHMPRDLASFDFSIYEVIDPFRRIGMRVERPQDIGDLLYLRRVPKGAVRRAEAKADSKRRSLELAEKRCLSLQDSSKDELRSILADLRKLLGKDAVDYIAELSESNPPDFQRRLVDALRLTRSNTSYVDYLSPGDLEAAKLGARALLRDDYRRIVDGGCLIVDASAVYHISVLLSDALELLAALGGGDSPEAAYARIRRKFHVADFIVRGSASDGAPETWPVLWFETEGEDAFNPNLASGRSCSFRIAGVDVDLVFPEPRYGERTFMGSTNLLFPLTPAEVRTDFDTLVRSHLRDVLHRLVDLGVGSYRHLHAEPRLLETPSTQSGLSVVANDTSSDLVRSLWEVVRRIEAGEIPFSLGRCEACGRMLNRTESRGYERKYCSDSCRSGAHNGRKALAERGELAREYVARLESGSEDVPLPFESGADELDPDAGEGLFQRLMRILRGER